MIIFYLQSTENISINLQFLKNIMFLNQKSSRLNLIINLSYLYYFLQQLLKYFLETTHVYLAIVSNQESADVHSLFCSFVPSHYFVHFPFRISGILLMQRYFVFASGTIRIKNKVNKLFSFMLVFRYSFKRNKTLR